MNRIVVTDFMLTELRNLESPLELCNREGQTLGYVVPTTKPSEALYQWARTAFTDEEIHQAQAERGGLSTADVLRQLKP